MSNNVDAIEKAVQAARIWLKEIQQRLETEDSKLAYNALKATLHALRDRLGPRNAASLGEQLPLLIKGLYYEGWNPLAEPTRERHLQAFLEHVNADVTGGLAFGPEASARAVLEVLRKHVDPQEVEKVEQVFPKELRQLWPASHAA